MDTNQNPFAFLNDTMGAVKPKQATGGGDFSFLQAQDKIPRAALTADDLGLLAKEEGAAHLMPVINAIYGQESGGGANGKTSTDGARGGMQVMPDTFRRFAKQGESIDSPADNMRVGMRIIKTLGDKFGNDPAKIATGYFSGEGNVNGGTGSAWKNDHKDGNGKSVSGYVSDVLGRLSPIKVAKAEESLPDLSQFPKWAEIASSPRFMGLSDEEKVKLKGDYFDDVLAPHAGTESGKAREQFMAQRDTAPGFSEKASAKMAGIVPAVQDILGLGGQKKIGSVMDGFDANAPQTGLANLPEAMQGSQTLRNLDGSVENRRARLVAQGEDPRFADRAAREAADAGVAPGAELAFMQKQRGTIGKSDFDFETNELFKNQTGLNNPLVRGVAKAGLGTTKALSGYTQFVGDVLGIDGMQAAGTNAGQWARGKEEAIGEKGNFLERNLEGAINSIGQQLPLMIAGVSLETQALPLAGMAMQTFGQEYSDGRSVGQTPAQATQRAAVFAAFEVIGEKFGLGDSMKAIKAAARGMPNDQIVGFLWSALKKEVPGELLTTTGQFATDKLPTIGLNQGATGEDYLKQVGDTIAQTIMQSGVMAGGTTGVSTAVRYLRDKSGNANVDAVHAEDARQKSLDRWNQGLLGAPRADVQAVQTPDGRIEPMTSPTAAPNVAAAEPTPVDVHPTSAVADSIVADLANQEGIPQEFVLPQQKSKQPNEGAENITDQDALDFAETRYRQLVAKRDGRIQQVPTDAGMMDQEVPGQALTPQEAAELAVLEGQDPAEIRSFYGMNQPIPSDQSANQSFAQTPIPAVAPVEQPAQGSVFPTATEPGLVAAQENQNAQNPTQAEPIGSAPSQVAVEPTGQPVGAAAEPQPADQAAASEALAGNPVGVAGQQVQPEGSVIDLSGRNEQQLRYLASNGQPGWKEAAQVELAKRGSTQAPAGPQGQFKTADEAQAYISAQRRRAGGKLPKSLPLPYNDGSFGLVTEGQAGWEEAAAFAKANAPKTEKESKQRRAKTTLAESETPAKPQENIPTLSDAPAAKVTSKPVDQLTDDEWTFVIGPIEGPARPNAKNDEISIDDVKLLKKMIVKAIKDGVAAGKTSAQIVDQIEALTKGGINQTGIDRIYKLLDAQTAAQAAAPVSQPAASVDVTEEGAGDYQPAQAAPVKPKTEKEAKAKRAQKTQPQEQSNGTEAKETVTPEQGQQAEEPVPAAAVKPKTEKEAKARKAKADASKKAQKIDTSAESVQKTAESEHVDQQPTDAEALQAAREWWSVHRPEDRKALLLEKYSDTIASKNSELYWNDLGSGMQTRIADLYAARQVQPWNEKPKTEQDTKIRQKAEEIHSAANNKLGGTFKLSVEQVETLIHQKGMDVAEQTLQGLLGKLKKPKTEKEAKELRAKKTQQQEQTNGNQTPETVETQAQEPQAPDTGAGEGVKREFTYVVKPTEGGFLVESDNGGGVVMSGRPNGAGLWNTVPPRVFKTEAAAREYMRKKGMTETDKRDTTTVRKAVNENVSTELDQKKPRTEKEAKAKRDEIVAFKHAGLNIYPVKVGGSLKWAVQTVDNAAREKAGERQIGGDAILDSKESAIAEAERFIKQAAADAARLAEIDAAQQQEVAAKAEASEAKAALLGDFYANKERIVRDRAAATLAKMIKSDGKVMTRADWVKSLIADGAKLSVDMVNKIKPMSRAQFNRASSAEQRAHEDKIKRGGKVSEHMIGNYVVSKTEYDYAEHLLAKSQQPEKKAEKSPKPAKTEKSVKADKARQQLEAHFTPGNIVFNDYWKTHNRVLGFDWNNGNWSATEEEVRQQDGKWVTIGAKRTHATRPGAKDKVVEQAVKETSAPAEAIADFGEKIGGARKDVWSGFKDGLNAVKDADIATEPLSKVWPAPDYQKLIDSGIPAESVSAIRSLRDEIPQKPRSSWKVKRWADQVKVLRDLSNDILNGSTVADLKKIAGANTVLDKFFGRVDLYQAVGHEKSLQGINLSFHHYTLYKGQENVSLWSVEQDVRASAWSNWPREIATGKTKEEAIEAFKKQYAGLNTEKAAKTVSFDIYTKSSGKGYWIGKKVGRNILPLEGPFETLKEARAYKTENTDKLVEKLAKVKEIPNERRDSNEPRVGVDMRNGQDVTPQMFGDTFGFRGVEFGNWVEQSKRQQDLNDFYDALMDMAAILGLPPKALSLNGELGLAFGARGTGGTNAAKAHYELDFVAINMTKKSGAGSLGHEWWHAVDNYFSRMRDKPVEMMTEALDVSLASRGSNFELANDKVRREMIDAFGAVVSAIKQTAIKARSSKLDAKRSKQYWTTTPEMSARAFESYLISKLQDQNAANDYLANIVDPETWKAAEALGFELDDSYPYPTAGEIPAIRAGFDKFFETVETKPNEHGGVTMFSRSGAKDTWYQSPLKTAFEKAPDRIFGKAPQLKLWLASNASKLGIKKDEIEWSGINEFLDLRQGSNVSKQEILDFLSSNGVKVQDVFKGEFDDSNAEAWWNDEGGANEETPFEYLSAEERRDAIERYRDEVGQYSEDSDDTKYSQYVLPGGENYKELLLTLPERAHPMEREVRALGIKKPLGDVSGRNIVEAGGSQEMADRWMDSFDGETFGKNYTSSHWGEKNVLAHIRFNDRIDGDGNKVLFIEELQSDWAQDARKKGFKGKPIYAEGMEGSDAGFVGINSSGVPEAPFIKDTKAWVALAIKRMVAYAAENGYDKVAFVNGDQSAERYDLSKQVSAIQYRKNEDGTFKASAIFRQRENENFGENLTVDQLEDYVGKEVAAKIAAGVGESVGSGPYKQLSAVDLKVGGEGMKSFYDKIVPQVANDVLKKLGGGKVETVEVARSGRAGRSVSQEDRQRMKSEGTLYDQTGFTITPAMREMVGQGLPLFSRGRSGAGMAIRDLKAVVDRARASLKNLPQVHVMKSPESLDRNDPVQSRLYDRIKDAGAEKDVEGATHDGEIYLFSDNLADEFRAEHVLVNHEVGHYGLREVFGKAGLDPILNTIYMTNAKVRKQADALRQRFDLASNAEATEEVLVEMEPKELIKLNAWRRLVRYIRDWLDSHGFGKMAKRLNALLKAGMTDQQKADVLVADVINAARDWVRNGAPSQLSAIEETKLSTAGDLTRSKSDIRFSQSDQPYNDQDDGLYPTTSADSGRAVDALNRWIEIRRGVQSAFQGFNSERLLEVAPIATRFGTKIVGIRPRASLTDDQRGKVAFFNGVYYANRIFLNTRTDRPHLAVLGHELVHRMRNSNPELYQQLVDAIRPYIDQHQYRANWKSESAARDVVGEDKIREEFVAEVMSDGFMDKDFWRAVGERNPTLLKRLFDMVSKLIDRALSGTGYTKRTEKYLTDYKKVMEIAGGVMAEFEQSPGQDNPALTPKFSRKPIGDVVRDLQSNVVQFYGNQDLKTFNGLNKTINTQFHKALKDKDFGRVYNLIQSMQNHVATASSRPAELAPGILHRVDNVGQAIKTIVSKSQRQAIEKAGEALFSGTLNGNSVMDGKVWTDQEMRDRFGMDDTAIALYRQARKAIDASLTELAAAEAYALAENYLPKSMRGDIIESPEAEVAAALILAALGRQMDMARRANLDEETQTSMADAKEKVQAIFAQAEKLKKSGYAPLMRFGKYDLKVMAIDPETGKVQRDENDQPVTLFYSRFETQAQVRKAEQEQREVYEGKQEVSITPGVVNESANELYRGVNPETLSIFAEAMGARQAVDEYIRLVRSERSAMKRQLERKGTPGYSRDIQRVMANFITSNARQASQQLYGTSINQAIRRIPKEKGDVQKEALDLRNYVINPNDNGAWGSSLMFAWFLGGSPASALINMTQPLTMTYPHLAQYGTALAAKEMTKAVPYAMGAKEIADQELRQSLKKASLEGIVDAQEVFHLYAIGSRRLTGWMTKLKMHEATGQSVMTLWGSMFSAVEGLNRRLTFIAAWNMAKAKGIENAYAFAVDAVNQTQGIYNKANRPNLARSGPGRAVFTFRTYSIMYTELMHRNWKYGGKNGKKAVLLMLAVLILASGIEGLPGANLLDAIIDRIGQFMGYDTNMKRWKRRHAYELLGKIAGDLVLYGASSLTPLDFGGRLGLGNMIPGAELIKGNWARGIAEFVGPTAGAAQQVGDAVDAAEAGNYGKAAINLAPKAGRDIASAIDMGSRGYDRDMAGRKTVETTGADAIIKGIGFNPTVIADKTRASMPVQQDIKLVKEKESTIVHNWAQAVVDNDRDEANAQAKKLSDWNRDNPDNPIRITPDQIRSRVRLLMTDKGSRITKTAPKEVRGRIGLELLK